MRVGMFLNYAGGFREAADEVAELEQAGIDLIAVPEAYSFDAVSQLGFLAARTSKITLASGILQLYTRTPTLTAMTAAGLDYVSDGRFELGIGASGPQVIEGFHGVRYDAPLGRTREIIDICRMTWRREPVVHQGAKYHIPLPAGRGHRARQAAEAHQPPRARAHPDHDRLARPEVGRADRRDRRRLDADVLPPRARRRRVGRRARRGRRQAGARAGRRSTSSRAPRSRSPTTPSRCCRS